MEPIPRIQQLGSLPLPGIHNTLDTSASTNTSLRPNNISALYRYQYPIRAEPIQPLLLRYQAHPYPLAQP